ncbi:MULTISPECIES: hypothetical protein [Campylobacter]|uniref:Uncharacterized protein n=3 Tax=Campylobacter TaxID=194 RepID=A0AAX2UIK9_9BACT|nr:MULTISPECIES: hypothetical protein [Campylobacter]ARE80895.1 hypothetical protein CHELV3228_1315 [Campylobacter helveticus]EAL53979.1 hypothetical protein CUP0740 [Campylobacter upsaliensis RM3195]MCR2039706.1 hypothetical protein [Campylobacter helveticus]MCR2055382.1 hypothetical protein [Campylobacter helveticus]MCR2056570.1 hypothetical protein [Campylobacter helveticus]
MKLTNNAHYLQNDFAGKNVRAKSYLDTALDKAEKELSKEDYIDLVGFTWASQSILNFRKNKSVFIKEYNDKLDNSSTFRQHEALGEMIEVLKSNAIQKGYFMGQAESEAHFQARKNQAIDYLSKLLQDIKV